MKLMQNNWTSSFGCISAAIVSILFLIAITNSSVSAAARSKSPYRVIPQIAHSGPVTSIAWSPMSQRFLTSGIDGSIKYWHMRTGRLLRQFNHHKSPVNTVAVSPDGALAASGGYDGTFFIWSIKSGKVLNYVRSPAKDAIVKVLFSRDAKRVFWANQYGHVFVSRTQPASPHKRLFDSPGLVSDMAASGNSQYLYTGTTDETGTVHSWKIGTREIRQTNFADALEGGIRSLSISPDSSSLVAGDWTGNIGIWSTRKRRLIFKSKTKKKYISAIAHSPTGPLFAVGGSGPIIDIWDRTKRQRIGSLNGISGDIRSLSYSPDGNYLVSGDTTGRLVVWNNATGEIKRVIPAPAPVAALRFIASEMKVYAGYTNGVLSTWQLPDVSLFRSIRTGNGDNEKIGAISADGKLAASITRSKCLLSLWRIEESKRLWQVDLGRGSRCRGGRFNIKISSRNSFIAVGDGDGVLILDSRSGERISLIKVPEFDYTKEAQKQGVTITSSATFGFYEFTTDESKIVVAENNLLIRSGFSNSNYWTESLQWNSFSTWSSMNGKILSRTVDENVIHKRDQTSHEWTGAAIAIEPRGREIAVVSADNRIARFDLVARRQIKSLGPHTSTVTALRYSSDGSRLAVASKELSMWNTENGMKLWQVPADFGGIRWLEFSSDDRIVIGAGAPGGVRIWDANIGRKLLMLLGRTTASWLALSEDGFLAGTDQGLKNAHVSSGTAIFDINQFRDHLYRPDLVEELLKGDPEGKYQDAASKLNLGKILDSGPAPQIELLQRKTERAGGTVRLSVRLKDEGGGIGPKLVWRVNGKTQGDVTPKALKRTSQPSLGEALSITQTLVVDPGRKNVIEVTAYNGAGLLATPPFSITVDKFGATTKERPRMHVLGIGVDNYIKKEYQLSYAVKDATSVVRALNIVGSTLFSKVSSTLLTDEQVTADSIEEAFGRIAANAKPTDVFVLFLAGHGKSIEGKYYYYPQTLDFAAGQTVIKDGIGQDQWQAWLAKLPVQKTLLILDTCESSAATGLVRGADSVRQTAMAQLQHATGHNLIAAARQAAYEGYKGHGVLTYSLLEALHRSATQKEEQRVKVGHLADHIDERVPQISQSLFGIYQKPTRKLAGNDFPIGLRRVVLTSTNEVIPKTPTHVVIRSATIRAQPTDGSSSGRTVKPGTLVRVVKFIGDWAIIARDGQKMGYLRTSELLKTQ